VKRVRFGGRTIKDGEAAAIWDVRGRHRQVVGPSREWMYSSTIRFLTRHKAESNQYIVVRHRNGVVEHTRGPASIYENPALHDNVKVHDGIELASNSECIIVYSDNAPADAAEAGGKLAAEAGKQADVEQVTKRCIKGPTLFMPAVGERVHEFKWSGTKETTLEANANVFNVLHTGSNRLWKLQLPVTTNDSMEFTVTLVFNYHMASLDKCTLSMDPIQKMYAGLRADSQSFGNSVPSEHLRAGQQDAVISRLASLQTFPFLCAAAEASGFCIDSVQVLGLKYSSKLQRQSDSEQQLAATLRAELAEKTQRRELHELELEDRRKRIEQEAELERRQVEVTANLEAESHALRMAAVERRLALQRFETEETMAVARKKDEAVLGFLRSLKGEGVDMTQFLCSSTGMGLCSSAGVGSEMGVAILHAAASQSSSKGVGGVGARGKKGGAQEQGAAGVDVASYDAPLV